MSGREGEYKVARAYRAVVALGVMVGLLTGCSGARPGIAVQAGDTRITVSEVTEATRNLCTAFKPQIKADGQTYPMKVLSSFVVNALAGRAVARQVADEYDIGLPTDYDDQIAEIEQASKQIDGRVRDTYVEMASAGPYAQAILFAAGRKKLAADGEDATEATEEALGEAGVSVFAEWAEENQVEIDPRYGVALIDGQFKPIDGSVSVAVSKIATDGQAEQMDPAAAAKLPAGQRCG
ncbi:MAG: hypothetical protein ACRCYQ_12300 [Nocardioides sp.]